MATTDELAEICRSWSPYSLATFYEWVFAEQGWKLPAHFWPVCLALTDHRIHNLQLIIGPGVGKALHPDTDILLDTGWKKIKDVKVGEYVRTPNGGISRIQAVMPQPADKLYKFTFADGRVIIAHKNHLWKVCVRSNTGPWWRIKTTEELLKYKGFGAKRIYVPLVEPIEYEKKTLPIPPYTLGCILGDGHVDANGSTIVVSHEKEIFDYIEEDLKTSNLSFSLNKSHNYTQGGILGAPSVMRGLGLAPSRSETVFVPELYKSLCLEDRWAFVQGLMDTDGYVDTRGAMSYTSTSLQLVKDLQEIVWSLGGIANIGAVKKPFYRNKAGEKVMGQPAYNLNISHPTPFKFFRMKRKIERSTNTRYAADLKLRIKSIEEIQEESPSLCINIADPEGLFIAENYVVTHNSQMLSVIYPTWLIGHDPAMTILGISGGESLMQGFQQAAQRIIESSPAFLASFPNVRPDKNAGWSAERGLFVTGHPSGIPDANYLAAGMNSVYVTGKHSRTLIVDDLHNKENSATAEQCKKVRETYYNTILGRADPMGARIIVAGRRWSTEDIYGSLIESESFVTLRLPFIRDGEKQLYYDVYVPDDIECVFTDRKVHCGDGSIVNV